MKVFELSIRCIYDYAALITALKLVIDDDGKEQHSVMVSKAEETLVKTDDEASIRNSVRQWEQKKSSIRYVDI